MKDQSKTEIKVGITVLVGIIIFLWILGWAKNLSITSTQQNIDVIFDNVAGLEVGDEVTVNGVRKGYVEDFNISGEEVIVTLAINEDVKLREDANFTIRMLDLMGGKKVEINPGSAEAKLNTEVIHKGDFYADIPYVMNMIGNAQGDLNQVLQDVKVTLGSLNNYLTDEDLNRNIKESVRKLNIVAGKLSLMIDENRESINKLVDNSAELSSEAKDFIKDNKDEIKNSINNINKVLNNTDKLITKIDGIITETKEQKNNAGKLLYDEKVYQNLNESLNQLNALTKILIEQLTKDGVQVDLNIF